MSKLPVADGDEKHANAEKAAETFKGRRSRTRTREEITSIATKTLKQIRKEASEGLEHYALVAGDDPQPAFPSPEAALAHVLAGGRIGTRPIPPEDEPDAPVARTVPEEDS